MIRKLTKFEVKNLVSDCPALQYALQVLDENPPLPLHYPHPLRDEVVERVRECAHAWMKGNVLDEELNEAIVGFCYLVRNYPEHPAFDSLRNDLSDAQISTALRKIGDTYPCRISPCVVKGAELYVVPKPYQHSTFDPLYLSTLGKLEPRLKDVGLKVLGDCLRAICMISTNLKRIPQHQHWAIARLIWDMYNYKVDFYYIRK